MARYKPYDLKQDKLIPLSFADQVIPGSFEHTLNEIVEHHLDMRVFEQRYRNDQAGRLAYDPKVMLKVVLYAYYKGIISSRKIEEACRRNVVFMALSADTRPHFTTIADFVTQMETEIIALFCDVLLYCDELGLIGREHFAVDGCKLPSNASKQWSGTHEELKERQEKLEKAAGEIVRRHRTRDAEEKDGALSEPEQKKLARYQKKIEKIKAFLATAPKKLGPSGNEQKTNIIDPDSAKMTTSHGVLQGFNGLAVADDRHQIVVHAEARGSGQEAHLLTPIIEAVRENFEAIGSEGDVFDKTQLTADSGYHSAKSVEEVEASGVDAYIADPQYRRRDPAFAGADRYKERHRYEDRLRDGSDERKRFAANDFVYDEKKQTCLCPAGHALYRSGREMVIDGFHVARFKAPKRACRGCALRAQCLRHPERHKAQRQVQFMKGRAATAPERPIDAMRRKFDSAAGRAIYAKRMPTIEPVFGNARNKRMDHFTLRGQRQVDAQWKLYMLVHNIEKIAHYGQAA
jgi:transposase